jgi:uncharacterized protein with PQ loop repeat
LISFFYLGGIISPLITLPQLIKIYYHHNAEGVSLTSWISWSFGALFLLTYGIVHKQKPLVFLQGMVLPIYIGIVIGILIYS